MKHAYAYVRTSAAPIEVAHFALAVQLAEIRRYAAERNYAIVATFEEHPGQGERNRPAFEALRGAVDTNSNSNPIIIACDRSRFFRNPIDFGQFELWLQCCNAKLELVDEAAALEKYEW
jgi:DNA invertase Pin-like site-specific DNA recombinase